MVYGRYSYSYWGLSWCINQLISGGPHPVAIQEDDYICTSQARKKMKQNNAFPAIPAITACFMASKKNAWGISSNFTIPGTPARPENPSAHPPSAHPLGARRTRRTSLRDPPRQNDANVSAPWGRGGKQKRLIGCCGSSSLFNNDLVFVGLAVASYQILTRHNYSPVIQR